MLLSRVAKQGGWGKVLQYPLHDYERLDPYRSGVTASRRARPVASTGQQATAREPRAYEWLMLVWPQRRPLGQWGPKTGQSLHP